MRQREPALGRTNRKQPSAGAEILNSLRRHGGCCGVGRTGSPRAVKFIKEE